MENINENENKNKYVDDDMSDIFIYEDPILLNEQYDITEKADDVILKNIVDCINSIYENINKTGYYSITLDKKYIMKIDIHFNLIEVYKYYVCISENNGENIYILNPWNSTHLKNPLDYPCGDYGFPFYYGLCIKFPEKNGVEYFSGRGEYKEIYNLDKHYYRTRINMLILKISINRINKQIKYNNMFKFEKTVIHPVIPNEVYDLISRFF